MLYIKVNLQNYKTLHLYYCDTCHDMLLLHVFDGRGRGGGGCVDIKTEEEERAGGAADDVNQEREN